MTKFKKGDKVIYIPDRAWRGKVTDTSDRVITVFWRRTKVHDDFTRAEARKLLRIVK